MKRLFLMLATTLFACSFSYAQSCSASTACTKATSSTSLKIKDVLTGSAAEQAGLKAGDAITAIDERKIRNVEGLNELLAEKQVGDYIYIQYTRAGKTYTTNARLGAREATSGVTSLFSNSKQPAYLGVQLKTANTCSENTANNNGGACSPSSTRKAGIEE